MTTAPHLDSTNSALMWDRLSGRSFGRHQSRLTDWKVRPTDFFNRLLSFVTNALCHRRNANNALSL